MVIEFFAFFSGTLYEGSPVSSVTYLVESLSDVVIKNNNRYDSLFFQKVQKLVIFIFEIFNPNLDLYEVSIIV